MKRRMKRPLAVLLALIMMFSTVSGMGLNLSAEELQTSGIDILTTEDSGLVTEEDKSGDTKDINQEDAPGEDDVSEGDELTESEESEDAAESSGDSKTEDKSDPVTETEDDADDAESEKTETPAEITRYDYKSDEVNVLVTLTDPADLPDAAELVVEPITLQREAQKNIEEAAAEEGIFVEEIKAFDIKFMLEGEEVQPGATVKVSVSVPEFKPSEEASAVYHVDENNEVENMESEVAADGEVVFDAPHFSTYVIVDGSIINDATKKITVTLKHYKKDGYTASDKTSYQLYTDDVIEVPVGGEIYNYIKADNWKPDTVVVDYTKEEDVTYTSSADLTEIKLIDDATVTVFYTPDSSRMIGDSSFYDYTVKAGSYNGTYYSINMDVAQEAKEDDSTALIVGYAGSSYDENYSSIYSSGKINEYWNKGGAIKDLTVSLDENGDVKFNYDEPGFFKNENWTVEVNGETRNLRKVHKDIQIGFEREGDTYNLDQVIVNGKLYNKGKKISGVISETGWNGEEYKGYSFYPLQDFKVPYEESGPNVNGFFGMRYDVEFFLGDYVGDLNFTYSTRDELWVLLDGNKLAVNKTGYQTVEDISVDLSSMIDTTNLNAKHTLTVLYLDRYQPDKSILEMSFTLPNAKIKEVDELTASGDIVDTLETSLKLKTVDQNNNSLEGARFRLKNMSTAATSTLVTTEDGVEFTGLTAGKYQLMLANAPDDCIASASSWYVTVEEVEGNLVVSMEEESGKSVDPENGVFVIGVTAVQGTKLVIRAVSSDGATLLGGARFRLEQAEEDGYTETLTSDFITGEISFNGLNTGEYTLTHIKAPQGSQLNGSDTEWKVEITMDQTSGLYEFSMTPAVKKSEDVYIFEYEVDTEEYTKPEEALNYDKTASVKDWDERTYEIDISATALETETITQLDTTYGMFVLDKSSTMFSTVNSNPLEHGASGELFGVIRKDLTKTVLYRVKGTIEGAYGWKADYVLYRDDLEEPGWYRFYYSSQLWEKMTDETVLTGALIAPSRRFEQLREVAVNYVKGLIKQAPGSKLGITTVYTNPELVTGLNNNVSESDLNTILSIAYDGEGSYLGRGLKTAFDQLFSDYEYKNGRITSVTESQLYKDAQAQGIPLYVIVVSDGKATDKLDSEQFAGYLKDKGIKIYTVAINTGKADKTWLKENIASFGCAYEESDSTSLSDIFSQIQRRVSVGTINNVTVNDYIDSRFVVLDDNGKQITEDYYCNGECEEGCTSHPFKEEVKITTDDDQYAMVGYDNQGQYIRWDNQSISAEENHWTVLVQARDNYLGGNNVTTNIDGISVIDTPNYSYPLPNPSVNVKAELKVDNNAFTIYKGEVVPTADAITKILFDVNSIIKEYDAFNLTGKFTLNWYTNSECTESTTLENIAKATPTEQTKYYLQVTYNAGIPTEESKENTTLNGTEYFVGEESTGNFVASNKDDSTLPYGVYTIDVWELIKHEYGRTDNPLPDAEFQLTSKVGSPMNTYYGKSDASGSVVWYTDSKYQTAVQEIKAGEYWLEESKAPAGYEKISGSDAKWEVKKDAAKGWTLLPSGTGISGETIDNDTDEDRIIEVYLANSKATHTITVTKKVTGNLGDKINRSFTFIATLTDAFGSAIDFPVVQGCTRVDGKTNEVTFTLKHDADMVITGIPEGATLAIKEDTSSLVETDGYDYTVESVKHGKTDMINDYRANGIVKITDIKEDSTLEFTNKKVATLDTGILSDTPKVQNTLLAVTFAASVIGILAYLDRKRSKYDYRQ